MEQSHWQTVIRWIVLHPERRTVLVSQREGRLVLPTSTSTGDIWLGDCPALLEPRPESDWTRSSWVAASWTTTTTIS